MNFVNPKPFLDDLKGQNISVRLKWGQEYRGLLKSFDAYMNLQVRIRVASILIVLLLCVKQNVEWLYLLIDDPP